MFPLWLAKQFAHPSGLLGRAVGWAMNRNNVRMNAHALERLELGPSDRVLELGFGGGINLARLVERARHVHGVEPSTAMIARARRTFADAIGAEKLALHEGTADSIPLADGSIDKALAVNSVYFWPDRPSAFRELRRVLAPGGLVALTFLRGKRMAELGNFPPSVFRYVEPDDVVRELGDAGFENAETHRADGVHWVTVTARVTP
jgi:arsenite methyltransferase